MAFSGGSYDEVARWLWNFLTSHARRVDPRIDVLIDAGDEREGKSYGARFRLGSVLTPVMEFPYTQVAENRGSLAWCTSTADSIRTFAQEHLLHTAAPASR